MGINMGENVARGSSSDKVDVKLRYLPQLDGLRAVAVALVVVHHLLQPARFGGWIGIDVFFVLSGYLITSLLRVEVERTGRVHLRQFYARRLLRLYPPLILAVLLILPVGLLLYPSTMQYLGSSGLALTYTTNVVATVLDQWVGPWTHTWTLALEEQFYLLWPLLLLVAVRVRRTLVGFGAPVLIAALAWLCISAAVPADGITSYNPLLQGAPLLAGCGLALMDRWRDRMQSGLVAAGGVLLLTIAAILGGFEDFHLLAAIPATIGTLGLLAYLVTARGGPLVTALSTPVAVELGKVSYEIYLWHYPLLILLTPAIPARPIVATIVIAGSLGMAFVSKRWVSGPITRVLKPKLEWIKP
jgi:peptidoglycan/LPS O-acetylase OafA/YrhL